MTPAAQKRDKQSSFAPTNNAPTTEHRRHGAFVPRAVAAAVRTAVDVQHTHGVGAGRRGRRGRRGGRDVLAGREGIVHLTPLPGPSKPTVSSRASAASGLMRILAPRTERFASRRDRPDAERMGDEGGANLQPSPQHPRV